MLENVTGLRMVSVLQGQSSRHRVYTERPTHGFVFKLDGESMYHFGGEKMVLHAGEVMLIPRGASYTVERLGEDASQYIVVNFTAESAVLQPKVYQLSGRLDFGRICAQLRRYQAFPTAVNGYRCMAMLYEMLADLTDMDKSEYRTASTFGLIEPAVQFMEEHMFDPEMKIGGLHTLCGVSDTYFRRIFHARFGVSPKRYVLSKRIRQAKHIMDSGEYSSIAEVAAMTGFDDPLYFSKVYKTAYGAAPSRTV